MATSLPVRFFETARVLYLWRGIQGVVSSYLLNKFTVELTPFGRGRQPPPIRTLKH